jgi:hypothetical protein
MLPIVLLAVAQPVPVQPDKPLVPFPHPLITEVLYAVPSGKDGDADQDGKRSATGDEFIELINPHDKPINLKGYVLSDASSQSSEEPASGVPNESPKTNMPYPNEDAGRPGRAKPGDKPASPGGGTTNTPKKESKPQRAEAKNDSRIRFVFPDLTLQPGEVVVVFNGHEGHPAGPVGTTSTAAKKNERFHNAYVLTMNARNRYVALSNTGDYVLLTDPAGKAVECVRWGGRTPDEGVDPALDETAPLSRVSVQRRGIRGGFVDHTDLDPAAKYSPGKFETKER